MKKIAALLLSSAALFAATPVFACPFHDGDKQDTADTTKKTDDGSAKETAKAQPKDTKATDTAKAADKAKATPKPAAKG